MGSTSDRLRQPPSERFAGVEHRLDFGAALEELRKEPHPAKGGHRQIVIFHSDALRLVLFAFDPGGRLPRHRAPGVVAIQALRGELRVTTPTGVYDLGAGQAVVLAPGVPHDVDAASGQADMLLSVALTGPRGGTAT